jgi:hypothetical protein
MKQSQRNYCRYYPNHDTNVRRTRQGKKETQNKHRNAGTFLKIQKRYLVREKDVEGSGMGLIWDSVPVFVWTGKKKSIPVTGRGGPYRWETSSLPHFLDNQLTDSGKVVSLKRRPPFAPRKIPGTHFS